MQIPADWRCAITAFLGLALDRLCDRNSSLCWWQTTAQKVASTFTRFALPVTWDFNEINPFADSSGGYVQAVEWEAQYVEHAIAFGIVPSPIILQRSATKAWENEVVFDIIMTDPPYYDAIGYSVLMDFFLYG